MVASGVRSARSAPRAPFVLVALAVFVVLSPSCSKNTRHHDEADGGDTDADTDADAGTDGGTDNDAGDGSCDELTRYVYAIDRNAVLYRFDPLVPEFIEVGITGVGTPTSMAVSRDGVAYVLSTDYLYHCVCVDAVDIADASWLGETTFDCAASGFSRFGMGFSTDGPDTEDETLFLSGPNVEGDALASVDLTGWSSSIIGPMTDIAELTGNSAGELWGFFGKLSPPLLARVDKETGAISGAIELSGMSSCESFAFAFWGGDFYMFCDGSVFRLTGDSVFSVLMPGTGIEIVGAGVSTCAPLEIE
jgi:hypothetical protein